MDTKYDESFKPIPLITVESTDLSQRAKMTRAEGPVHALGGRLRYFALTGMVLILDRITKLAIQRHLSEGDLHVVIPGFFQLVHFHNPGVAFGLFAGSTSGLRTAALIGTGLVAVAVVLFYGWRHSPDETVLQSGLALVLGGALGNLIDRVVYGHVVDFLYFNVGEYYWPAFNVADSAITAGVALLLIVLVRDEARSRS